LESKLAILTPYLIVTTKYNDHRLGRAEAAGEYRQAWDRFRRHRWGVFSLGNVRPAKDGRYAAIGYLDGVIVVIFVDLGSEGISIISARPASRRERSLLE
jgi:hypothetical protein